MINRVKLSGALGDLAGSLAQLSLVGGAVVYAATNCCYTVEGGHRAIVFNRQHGVGRQVRVLARPMPDKLPIIYKLLGKHCNEIVLPSIIQEGLKAVSTNVGGWHCNRARVPFVQEVVKKIRKVMTERAWNFNIAVDDVCVMSLKFEDEFTNAIEAKQVAAQEVEHARFLVQKAEQEKIITIIKAQM
ncbi:hypothetical protein EJB05_25451, partial [Eragrostis curvula]